MATVVIAVRGGETAKSRLAPVLAPEARARLVAAMLQDMLDVALQTPAARQVWVITPTPQLALLARSRGARVLSQGDETGLNAAFRRALVTAAAEAPGEAVVLLPGDLPMLERSDLEAAIRLAEGGQAVIAPARRGGTGALVVGAGDALAPDFGGDSFHRHAARAAALGREPAILNAASLACDIDEPDDLPALARSARAHNSRAILSRLLSKSEDHVPVSA